MPLPALYLRRGLALWLLARAAVVTVMSLAGAASPAGPLDFAPAAAALMVPLSVALGLADVAWRGERALLGNLGVPRARLVAWLALPAALGELAAGALHAL